MFANAFGQRLADDSFSVDGGGASKNSTSAGGIEQSTGLAVMHDVDDGRSYGARRLGECSDRAHWCIDAWEWQRTLG